MSAEDMTIDEALAHANCSAALSSSPAHVAKALQVLAQAYRVELAKSAPRCTCDYAGVEGERHKDFCEIEGGPHVECRYRIADLESQLGQQSQIMREQGAELRGAEQDAYDSWCAAQDGPS